MTQVNSYWKVNPKLNQLTFKYGAFGIFQSKDSFMRETCQIEFFG